MVGKYMSISTMAMAENHFGPSKLSSAKPIFLSLCALLSLAACTSTSVVYTDGSGTAPPYNEVPISSNFRTSAQFQLQAAQHWANIADDTGQAISALLRTESVCNPVDRTCASVFINPPAMVTEFSRTFHNQLITTLVNSGMNISKTPESSVLIDIDVQPVFFESNRPQYRHAGKATELGPGIWALRDVMAQNPADPANAPAEADALHWFRSEFAAGRTPKMEIVVTVSASTRSRYLARATNVYYVTEGDRRLYDQEICSLIHPCVKLAAPEEKKVFAVEEKKVPPLRARVMTVTGDCPNADKPCDDSVVKPKKVARKK